MNFEAQGWFAQAGGGALQKSAFAIAEPGPGEVVIAVDACGLCHTDFGFARAEVAPRHALPLVLGHEMVGRVLAVGGDLGAAESLVGRRVLVPAVLPCGDCAFCREGRGNACQKQAMPGNDIHGGFASHALLPARALVPIDDRFEGGAYRSLGVVADAVSTAYQATRRAGLKADEVAVVVGTGGVGGFVVQIARALGAHVLACDVKNDRLKLASAHGAEAVLDVSNGDPRALKKALADFARVHHVPSLHQKVFECSGNPRGQSLAYGAIPHAGTVVFVGYTFEKLEVRLSNLMALDATALGTWGCPTELYPEVLAMVSSGAIKLAPFVQEAPMSTLNDCLDAMAAHRLEKRMVLVPDFA